MSLMIHELLSFPLFQSARLLAGKKGESNSIRWATILEVLDDINHLESGELLITTAFDLHSNPELKKKLIKQLVDLNLSGIIIQTGYYLEKIPDNLLHDADNLGFPLIEIPRTITFSEITKLIHRQIIHKQYEKIEFSEQMYKRFTDVALNNEGLYPIVQTVGNLIHGKVIIHDSNLNQLSSTKDPYNSVSLTSDMIMDYINQFKEAFEKENLLEAFIQSDPYFILIVPIKTKNVIYGYITTAKHHTNCNDFEQIVIKHAATICTLEFIKLSSLEERDNQLKADFLELLFSDNDIDELTIYSNGETLGYHITAHPTCVTTIYIDGFEKIIDFEKIKSKIFQLIYKTLQEFGLQSLFKQFSGHFVVLITNQWVQRVDISNVMESINRTVCEKFNITLSIGIGNYYTDFKQYKYSYKESQESLYIIQSVWKNNKTLHYKDMGLYKLLLPIIQNEDLITQYYQNVLGELVDNHELMETLKLYLNHLQKMNEVADKLFIHRHTLKYRLNKIEEITKRNLTQFQDRIELELALIVHQILQKN